MYISLDWISDFVDLTGFDPKEIANKLTLSTAEVESVEMLQRSIEGVLIGKIVEAKPISDKKLTFCTVDCGSQKYTTVCGAPNARVGLIAPFAPAGTVLAGGKKIEKGEKEGFPTEGVLCSAAELGMSEWHEILLECPPETKIGAALSDYVPKTDVLIEVDNKSLTHRPDLWGHYGFAREFAAIFDRPLKALPCMDLRHYMNMPENQENQLPKYPLIVEDSENCPAYACIEMEFKEEQPSRPSPLFMQRRLHALGQRTYNLLVDVTNYVNREIGQPTHAFDGELISGIRVAQSGVERKFRTLDGQERTILPEDLLINGVLTKPGEKTNAIDLTGDLKSAVPVALAGIMGGLETEVSEKTKKVLLESANFKAGRIRKTSSRLDLRTDASQRYEKSQPPCNVRVGAERIAALLEAAGLHPVFTSQFTLAGDLAEEFRPITLQAGQLDRLAGISLSREKVGAILVSLGYTASFDKDGSLQVGVPAFRSVKDISIPEDIVEEVLRIYGFDNIPPIMPVAPIQTLHVEKHIKLEHRAKKLLSLSHAFIEVHHYGWFNDAWLAKIGFDPGETLVLRNPAAQGEARMRTTLLPNLFALVPKNRPMRDRFRIFELGHVYLPDASEGSEGCRELSRLSGVSFQQSGSTLEDHYLEIKSAIENLGPLFNGEALRFTAPETSDASVPWKTAGCYGEIFQGEVKIGSLGVLEKSLLEKVSPEGGQVVWFEVELEKFSGELFPVVHYAELPKFPGSWQDFSLVWSIDAGFSALEKELDAFAHPLLKSREFVVAYKGKGLEKGTASYSFRFWIGAEDHTLSGEEIDSFHATFLAFLKEKGISLRA